MHNGAERNHAMNKSFIIIFGSILALFVMAGLAFLVITTLANPAPATPTLIPTQTAVIVTLTPGPSATSTLTETPAPTNPPTQTAQVVTVTPTPRVITATPGKTPTAALTATKPAVTAAPTTS